MSDRPAIDALRGALVLCDHVAPMTGNKWLIAGTYTHAVVSPGARTWDCPGLQAYVRILTECAGAYRGRLLLINRALPSNVPPLYEGAFDIRIDDPRIPLEFAWKSPPFSVAYPPDPAAVGRDEAFGLPLLLWLEVDGKALASTPLNVIFRPHQGPPHVGDDQGNPDLHGPR